MKAIPPCLSTGLGKLKNEEPNGVHSLITGSYSPSQVLIMTKTLTSLSRNCYKCALHIPENRIQISADYGAGECVYIQGDWV